MLRLLQPLFYSLFIFAKRKFIPAQIMINTAKNILALIKYWYTQIHAWSVITGFFHGHLQIKRKRI